MKYTFIIYNDPKVDSKDISYHNDIYPTDTDLGISMIFTSQKYNNHQWCLEPWDKWMTVTQSKCPWPVAHKWNKLSPLCLPYTVEAFNFALMHIKYGDVLMVFSYLQGRSWAAANTCRFVMTMWLCHDVHYVYRMFNFQFQIQKIITRISEWLFLRRIPCELVFHKDISWVWWPYLKQDKPQTCFYIIVITTITTLSLWHGA